jgi:hypothetical protein
MVIYPLFLRLIESELERTMETFLKTTGLLVMAAVAVVVTSVEVQAGGCRSYGHHYNYSYCRPVYRTPIIIHKPIVHVVQPRPVLVVAPPRVVVPVPVQPVVVPQPLQMLAVRFVDPGFAAKGVGPRYRVTIKNIGPVPIQRVFDIVLAAGVDPQFSPELPSAAEQVVAMGPGEIISLDIRLPVECLAMKFPGEDRPAPFSHLFVMLAEQQDLLGNVSIEKLALVPRIGLPMVDLAIAQPASNVAPVGAKVQLSGEGFGLAPGRIILEMPGVKLNARVLDWNALGAVLELPQLNLAAPAAARLVVIRTDGQTAPAIPVKLVPVAPAQPVIEVPVSPGPGPAVAPAAFRVVQPQAAPVQQVAPQQRQQQSFGVLAPQGQPQGQFAPRQGQPAPVQGQFGQAAPAQAPVQARQQAAPAPSFVIQP